MINDVISRQAAIDAVSKGCQEWRGIFGRCEENLLALPSAQPEIIQCENCEHWDGALRNGFYYFEHCSLTGRDCCSYDFCSWAERRKSE